VEEGAGRQDDDAVADPPVAGVPGIGPVPAHSDQPAATDTAEDPPDHDAADHPAVQEVEGKPETASGG
jgi:hypothetical protein